MTEITRILSAIEEGDLTAAQELLPLVYDELRRLARQKMSREAPGHTLQATALVHEAYLRLVGNESQRWDSRGHFFAAAAESMRRILIESVRAKSRVKRGGGAERIEFDQFEFPDGSSPAEALAISDALDGLAEEDQDAAELVKLRYFAGLSLEEVAELLSVSRATAYRRWAYARAWLRCELGEVE